MFNQEDDYLNATKDAQIYTSVAMKSNNKKLIILNFVLLAVLGYLAFNYLEKGNNLFSSLETELLPVSEQAVLGVSEVVDTSVLSDDKLIQILRVTEVDLLEEEFHNSMKILMNEPSIQSKSSYTEAISRELDDKSGFRGRITVVKKGDTLSSIAEKYYGNSMMFSKIIQSNQSIKNDETILKAGQIINIPY